MLPQIPRQSLCRFTTVAAVSLLAAATLVSCARQPAPDAAITGANSPAVRILNASYYAITQDKMLSDWVQATAVPLFKSHCASCHGDDMKGKPGVPNLADNDTLWGWGGEEETDEGNYASLVQTITHGLRNQSCPDSQRKLEYGACPDTRYSSMVGFGKLGALTAAQINDTAEYVLSLSKKSTDAKAAKRGAAAYVSADCNECHGAQGYGVKAYGGPNLTDDVWLYGGDKATIIDIITNGRGGACPPWRDKLDAASIRALAAYLYGKSME